MEQPKVDVEDIKSEIEKVVDKIELRNVLADYMKEWNQFAKPVLMDYARAKQEVIQEEKESFPVASEMKTKAAAARMKTVKDRIRWGVEAGFKEVTLEEYLVDAAVLTELSKGEFRVTPEQYVLQRYRVQWE